MFSLAFLITAATVYATLLPIFGFRCECRRDVCFFVTLIIVFFSIFQKVS